MLDKEDEEPVEALEDEEPVTKGKIDGGEYPITEDDFQDLNRHLWQCLISSLDGTPKVLIKSAAGCGFKAWKKLTTIYDQRAVLGQDHALAHTPDTA